MLIKPSRKVLDRMAKETQMPNGSQRPMISISVVSHAQAKLVSVLLRDLVRIAKETPFEILLTKNLPENMPDFDVPSNCSFRVIENQVPRGFGHNHNAAFALANSDYFCVLNPDIRMLDNPFPELLKALSDPSNAIAAPQILGIDGIVQDSIRRFPTPWGLIKRTSGIEADHIVPKVGSQPIPVDWAAGMFLLMRSAQYDALGGFDRRYFLYCEDVDLSARAWKSGKRVMLCPKAAAIHDARRTSHVNPKYLIWHVKSYIRYFVTHLLHSPHVARTRVEAELEQSILMNGITG